ncbi:MAG: glutamine synthetase III [Vescimonas sp.]|uniref:glutamine synthetase III family protein n=1 Tax=Vescimonas sp. TaxID=2892404 RepID=UPI002A912064|nr:glutamine synthetase III [Vescimonas sp.]MDY5334475.1 glutamine synthetase III [Vescimonas sp.]
MCEKITNVPALFGQMVFGEQQMQQRLPADIYQKWQQCLAQGTPLDRSTAGEIANAMKDWALEKGATHYTHWFQPMTGFTAEKHDSFITRDGKDGVVMELSAKELSKGEADASSFPSGGLRATFEARGYTAWDPTSYAFVKDETLYIPTIFCSYSGQTLDKKTPLLRSMRVLDKECIRILRLFGNTEAQHVTPQVGPEQEYFLIDEKVYRQREDLKLCGRTLFGARPSKGQELDDHYYGAIKPRVAAFMRELDQELWKLGVLAKTEHNEVAPAQHEIAPIYSDANSACDKNQLTMELLKKVAARHGLVCLLHEKPFAGVNGSGKHDNWSLATDTGENLLKPGSTPSQNAQFLLFLAAFIKGVDEYQEMLRCCVSYPGNDHRLGGNEAPPAIISIFLGDELTAILDSIIQGTEYVDITKKKLTIGVDTLPEIPQDTTDRNRTSPLAFTGNKFEFRMLGSSQSIASPNVVLNTIMAEELSQFADILEKADDFQSALQTLLHDTFTAHQRIIFNGNGYDESWVQEAKRRGLANLRDTVDCMPAYIDKKNIDLFTRHAILTETEMRARYEIHLENYCKVSAIEANTLLEMAMRGVLPAVARYSGDLAKGMAHKQEAQFSDLCRIEKYLIQELGIQGGQLLDVCQSLSQALENAPAADSGIDAARYYRSEIVTRTQKAGELIGQLESLVDAKAWPYPTYADILFSV